MDKTEFTELLGEGIRGFGGTISPEGAERLYLYFVELKRWSARVNLIARETEEAVIIEKHFVDSLALFGVVEAAADILLDVGSGAGFPGLVCKAARPELDVVLAEPRLKRVSFLRHVARTCGLDSLEVLPLRVDEQTGIGREEEYTCVVSRAVTDISRFLMMCGRFCRPGTRIVCMKGPRYEQELEQGTGRIDRWRLADVKQYRLPFSKSSRALLVFEQNV